MSHVMRKLFILYANNEGADQPAHPHPEDRFSRDEAQIN